MQGFASGELGEVYRVKNLVYGVRNSSYLQYNRTCKAMKAEGFVQIQYDSCLCYRKNVAIGTFVIAATDVDDILCV